MLLICGATGCTFEPRPAPTTLRETIPAYPEPIRPRLSMGAGDALGEHMFIDNRLASRGPILVETASIAGD
jgi:hypothetical protein